jgi:hypothetical protein
VFRKPKADREIPVVVLDPDSQRYANGAALPGPHAKLAGPTFEEWLDAAASRPRDAHRNPTSYVADHRARSANAFHRRGPDMHGMSGGSYTNCETPQRTSAETPEVKVTGLVANEITVAPRCLASSTSSLVPMVYQ